MRKLVVTENISLDGVIEAKDYWFGPAGDTDPEQAETDQSDLADEIARQREAADAFLVGRTTFEQMRSFWPLQTDDTTGITDYLNQVAKYVVSASLEDPDWAPTTVLRGPLREDITALKSQPGKDIVTTGSITLVHSLIAEELAEGKSCSSIPRKCPNCDCYRPGHSPPASYCCDTAADSFLKVCGR
jgi:dihydrofolate reductase